MFTSIEILIAFLGLILGFPHGTYDWFLMYSRGKESDYVTSIVNTSLLYLIWALPILTIWYFFPGLGVLFFLALTIVHWGHEDYLLATEILNINIYNKKSEKISIILSRGGITVIFPLVFYHKQFREVVNIILGFFSEEGILDWLFISEVRMSLFSIVIVLLYLNIVHEEAYLKQTNTHIFTTFLLSMWFLFIPIAISIPVYLALYHSSIHMWLLYREGVDTISKGILLSIPYLLGSVFLFLIGLYIIPSAARSILHISSFYLIFLSILTVPHTILTFSVYANTLHL